ncbi:MAG: 2-iminoacetate synthase ThiH [Desulfamplus sp.]|nr:2-iminoacetate synthase ThiH [Desulfamplus sp.]
MSFYKTIRILDDRYLLDMVESTTTWEIEALVNQKKIDEKGFLKLLSPAGSRSLEKMAQKSRKESLNHFGKAILLYSPIYISNYCVNRCIYCNFNHENNIDRKILDKEEIRKEGEAVRETGVQHILILTGESRTHTPVSYIEDALDVLVPIFSSVVLEVYPLKEDEYRRLIKAGADGVTIYQETYDETVYDKVHLAGPKKDYAFRLDAPERSLKAGARTISLGVLLGLADWRLDLFKLGLHAKYLSDRYPDAEIGLSLPRIKKIGTSETARVDYQSVSDRDFVQMMCALRLFLPFCTINISTRESSDFREKLIPIGINKMSGGVSTEVGGYATNKNGCNQFEISDHSSVEDVMAMIEKAGYQPIMKDWMTL